MIYLRALEIDDYKFIYKWRVNDEINSQLIGNKFFVSSERERKSIENKIFDDSKDLYLAICLKENEKIIGFCSINNIDLRNRKAEWGGTYISSSYIGKGYGLKSAKLLLNFLFNEYPIHKCYASCLENHPATPRLFNKLGFRKDGILRDDVFKEGEFKNVAVFSVLRSEYGE